MGAKKMRIMQQVRPTCMYFCYFLVLLYFYWRLGGSKTLLIRVFSSFFVLDKTTHRARYYFVLSVGFRLEKNWRHLIRRNRSQYQFLRKLKMERIKKKMRLQKSLRSHLKRFECSPHTFHFRLFSSSSLRSFSGLFVRFL